MFGLRVTKIIGIAPAPPTPLIFPPEADQATSKFEQPLVTKSTLPESSASTAAPPLLNTDQLTLRSEFPRAFASFSMNFSCSMIISGR